jgi:pimeloyl-ACP methyl ester carboxylesterase
LYWGGNTSTYFQESVDTLERLDLPPAVGVLIVAPPGYDGSAGHPEPEGVLAAARLARDWLVRERRAERVVTGGFSMGALSALIAAEDPHVVATVLLASFTVFETGDPSRLIRFLEPVRYFPPSSMPKVKALVLHGEKDDGLAPPRGRDVATALGAEFVLVPDCGHVALQRNAVALARAKNFILGALSGP